MSRCILSLAVVGSFARLCAFGTPAEVITPVGESVAPRNSFFQNFEIFPKTAFFLLLRFCDVSSLQTSIGTCHLAGTDTAINTNREPDVDAGWVPL